MIAELAKFAGVSPSYTDFFGNVRVVSTETKRAILDAMGYPAGSDREAAETLRTIEAERRARRVDPVYVVRADAHVDLPFFSGTLEPGYHTKFHDARTTVIAVPAQAYVPPAVDEPGAWGFALQLYSLRSDRDWGIGDFGDLARFAQIASRYGAQTLALNPLHQLHLNDPAAASPYSPLSRLHLNVLYIDVPAAARFLSAAVRPPPEIRHGSLVDYPVVANAKIPAFHELYRAFAQLDVSDGRVAAFRAFVRSGGPALRNMAVYEALTGYFARDDKRRRGWLEWPEAFHNPRSPAVAAFEAEHRSDVEFFAFMQWLADRQLHDAADAAGLMGIGLYRDLAVGVNANSVDVWADRDAYCMGIAVGAPPDPLNTAGQNWGLPPLNPVALRARAYMPFIATLRANMRHAGALRIDHVMGLMRLFCIPHGAHASEGAYVDYPLDDLTGIVALESVRNRCMIVGEDLGTVPAGFRERMAERRIFSCRLLYFERDESGAFCDPATYPHDAVASTGTHDLLPLAGYWRDMSEADRDELLRLIGARGADANDLDLVAAAYRALSRTGAGLLLVQMEDALVQCDAVNVPGTTTEEPNWRRRLPVALDDLERDVRFLTIVQTLRGARSGKIEST